jgi:DNA-binding CsgD family transcriptional regulator
MSLRSGDLTMEVDRLPTIARAFARAHHLSVREEQLVCLVLHGESRAQTLSKRLGRSTHTVNNHFKNIFRRTHARGKVELVTMVLRHFLTESDAAGEEGLGVTVQQT